MNCGFSIDDFGFLIGKRERTSNIERRNGKRDVVRVVGFTSKEFSISTKWETPLIQPVLDLQSHCCPKQDLLG
jgi:hypothetical protein